MQYSYGLNESSSYQSKALTIWPGLCRIWGLNMTASQTIEYLQKAGFFGAQLVGGDEVVFLKKEIIEIYIGDVKKNALSAQEFATEYAHCAFRRVRPLDVVI